MGVRFGECELSVERIELRRAGQIVDMEPQVFDVLAYLLRHRERVVPKTELLDQIWGNRFVSESALSSRIKSARRAVGDTGRDQRIIKTVYGRGYRFVADANKQPATADPAAKGGTAPEHRVLQAVGDVAAGIGAAIQISGGPGSGKTELLHRVAETARRQALAVGLSAPTPASRSPYRASPTFSTRWPVPTPGCSMRSRPGAGPNLTGPSTDGCPRHASTGSWPCASSSSSPRSSRARCSCSTTSISLIAKLCSSSTMWPG